MGTSKVALVAIAFAALLGERSADAESCTGVTSTGGRFATCFDLGNRLSVTAGSNGFGLALAVRHEITFEDDPDLEWKMEHVIVDGRHAALDGAFSATVYRGRYLRHARDGHIVIPLGTPKKVFLPFDIGALSEVGRVDWRPLEPTVTLGVVRVAPLVDFARARGYRSLFAVGPVAHWDMGIARDWKAVTEHVVAPFTEGMLNIHLESATGVYAAEVRVEAGMAWRSDLGWRREARAEAALERIVLAINDRPIALTMRVAYDTVRAETVAAIGARFVIFDRPDPRVSLSPLRSRAITPPPAPLPSPLPIAPLPDPEPELPAPEPAPADPAISFARQLARL